MNKTEVTDCIMCKIGHVCPKIGNINKESSILCQPGYYCPNNETHISVSPYEIPCPRGTYFDGFGATSVNDCEGCPSGYACNTLGTNKYTNPMKLCQPGYYCQINCKTTTPTDGITGVN